MLQIKQNYIESSQNLISIIGKGKMGENLTAELIKLGYRVQVFDSKYLVTKAKLKNSEFVIDCSVGSAFLQNLPIFLETKQKIIVVATGWYKSIKKVKNQIKKENGILLWGDNFSIGMLLYKKILQHSCQLFSRYSNSYDLYGLEHHHNQKKDSPAGTTQKISDLILDNFPQKNKCQF
jgi:4-hydroxy-tetrahydrodipicolinate reductase